MGVRSRILTISTQSAIYGSGVALNGALHVVLLPVYTRYLTPADYGTFSLLVLTGTVFRTFTQLQLGPALFREVLYEGTDEDVAVSSVLSFLVLESLFSGLLMVALSSHLSNLILGRPDAAGLVRFVFLAGIVNVTQPVMLALLRIRGRPLAYAALSLVRSVVTGAILILAIVTFELGLPGVIAGIFVSEALNGALHVLIFLRTLRFGVSLTVLRRCLRFGLAVLPAALASQALSFADRYLLQALSSPTELGLYAVGYDLSLAMNLAVQAVQLAWPAQMYLIAREPDAEDQFAKLLTHYIAALGFIGLVISVFAEEIVGLLTAPEFHAAHAFVPLIVISYVLYGARFITNTALYVQNKLGYMSPILVGAVVLNLGLNVVMIPRYGGMGAAIATVVAYLVLFVVQTAVNLRFWYIPYEYGRISKLALSFIAVYLGTTFVTFESYTSRILVKSALLVALPLSLYLLGYCTHEEIRTIKRGLGPARMSVRAIWRRLRG